MKILMFGWEFPPFNSGGLGVASFGLVRSLVAQGAEVLFVLPKRIPVSLPGCTFIFADEAAPMDARVFDSLQSAYISEDRYRLLRGLYPELQYGPGLFDEVLKYATLARLIAEREEFDIIHAHDWLTFLAGLEAKRVSGKPLVTHVHATEFDRTGNGSINQMVYAVEHTALTAADRIIAVSGYTKNMLVDHYGVPGEKIEIVYNGIDPDDNVVATDSEMRMHTLKEAGNSIVFFAGRLTLQKGPDYFLKVAKKVLEYKKNVIFVVSGAGDMERQLMDEAAYLGISDRVFFVGFLRGQALARMYAMADLFVMPSVSEPFGIVPLESLLNGTPVLLSKQSGVREVLHHALTADFWDTESMADQIIGVVNNTALRTTLAENGGREARAQVWKRSAEKCMMIYKKLFAHFKPIATTL